MLSLAHASLLLLAPLGILAVVFAARSSSQTLSRARRAASLAVRCLIVLLLTLALGGPVFTRVEPFPRFTVFLLDASDSIPKEVLRQGLAQLKPRWDREGAAGHRCALVAFAGRTHVTVPPSSQALSLEVSIPSNLDPHSTDLARAIETARTLFQDRAANRVVLLSDGVDSIRPVDGLALPAGTLGVPLVDPARLDAAIVDVQAPLAVRSGEPFDVRVTLSTNRACEVGLSVVIDEVTLSEAARRVSIPGPGRHSVTLPALQRKAALPAGLHRLLVLAEIPGDAEPRNNVGLAAITVTGKPKVLLIEGAAAAGEFLSRVLVAQDIDFVRQSPAEFSRRADSLDEFVAVILAGVPRDALPAPAVAALRAHVEHSGAGLWVVGGRDLQGPAGYAGSDLEKLLPVAFSDAVAPVAAKPPPTVPPPTPPPAPPPAPPEPHEGTPQKVLAPAVALMLIVDKSGSMAGRNIEIVKEACIATAEALTRKDVVSVIAFDYKPSIVLEFTEADRSEYIRQRILRLLASGGTRIQPALALALHAFEVDPRAQRCAVKHAVLLSDGDAPAADYETVVSRMAEQGITVSTVCVSGATFDPVLMSQIATWGKGRFKFTNSFSNVPKLILQEAQRAVAAIPKDEAAPPPPAPAPKSEKPPPPARPPEAKPEDPPALEPVILKDPHEIFAGIEGGALPGLYGRLAALARPKADVPLTTKEGKPILAFGRLGLGKTAVWTSDLSGPWSSDWLKWKDASKLFAQLVRYVSGSGPDSELASRVSYTRQGTRGLLKIDPAGPGGAITVADAAGTPLPIVLDASAEGSVEVALDRPGDLKRLLLQRADGKKLALGAVRAYEEEFAPSEPSRNLFSNGLPALSWTELDARLVEERLSGERRRDLVPWLIIAALLLLPLDVALRRIVTA